MVRSHSSESVYQYPWDKVVAAFLRRYPNPSSGHIISEDVIIREVRPDGCLRTVKYIIKRGTLSSTYSWAIKFIPGGMRSSTMPILEESIINPLKKRMEVRTLNICHNWRRILGVVEMLKYRVNPSDPRSSTLEERSATFSSPMFGLKAAIEKFGYEKYRKNIAITKKGFLDKLGQLYGGNQL